MLLTHDSHAQQDFHYIGTHHSPILWVLCGLHSLYGLLSNNYWDIIAAFTEPLITDSSQPTDDYSALLSSLFLSLLASMPQMPFMIVEPAIEK